MLTDPLRDTAAAWLAAGRPATLVQVVQARGSVPRGEGTRMLVSADAVAGTIGGGHLEQRAIEAARRQMAAAGVPRPTPSGPHDGVAAGFETRFDTRFDTHYPLGPALGQCCGGAVTLRTQPLDAAALAAWPQPEPRFWVQLHGAGHVGRAIVRVLATLPCQVQWVDERESEFPLDALPSHIERICVEPVEAEVAAAPPGCCFLVLTHSHDLDLAITEAIPLVPGHLVQLGADLVLRCEGDLARGLSLVVERGLNVRETEALVRQEAARPRQPRSSDGAGDPHVKELAERLTSNLGLEVGIRAKGDGGLLTIRYHDLGQLDGLIRRLG